jgi:AraC-like DNA-binding protein
MPATSHDQPGHDECIVTGECPRSLAYDVQDPVPSRGFAKIGDNVTQIATEYGFLEVGRFAHQYRQLFGEYPNETLRR